jgi:hypothetical protein
MWVVDSFSAGCIDPVWVMVCTDIEAVAAGELVADKECQPTWPEVGSRQ